MRFARFFIPLVAAASALTARDAVAECTKDIECKGDRICVAGACTAPSAEGAAPVPPPAADAPQPEKAVTKRRSQALLVTGIVSMSLTPVALGAALFASFEKNMCADGFGDLPGTSQGPRDCSRHDPAIYGGLLAATGLLGGGLAMLLVGVQRVPVEPASTAVRLMPWLSRSSGGVSFGTTF
jgi:hypothetical protein